MTVKTASFSEKGGRAYNEDSVRLELRGNDCAVCVADGLGAHGGGEIASKIVADGLVEGALNGANLGFLFNEVNERVLTRTKGKSTGVLLSVSGGAARFAHVGDTRLYHFEDGKIIFQTLDHSVSQMAVFSGEIKQSEIRFHPDRNKVLRAFGSRDNFKPEFSPEISLSNHRTAFLLCTDGFWEYLPENIAEKYADNEPRVWLEKMRKHIEKNAPGDSDNRSAALIIIEV